MRLLIAYFVLALALAAPAQADLESKLKAGDTPPDYLGKTLDGDKILLSDHRGKIIVVTFWATWCAPCLKEIPIVNEIQRQISPENLLVVGVNFGEKSRATRKVVEALEDVHMTFTVDARKKVADKFDVQAVPHMFIVGVDGKIAATHLGYSENAIGRIVDELNGLLIKAQKQETQPSAMN